MADRINRSKHRAGSFTKEPKFDANLIKGDKVVLTIENAVEYEPDGNKPFIAIHFIEFPGVVWTSNREQGDLLMGLVDENILPDSFVLWSGNRVAFERVKNINPENGKTVEKFYPMNAAVQKSAIAEFDKLVEKEQKKGAGK